MSTIVPLFTTLLQQLNYDPPKDLLDYVQEYYEQYKYRGVQRSVRLGWQSKPHKIPQLKPVQDYLSDNVYTTPLMYGNAWINVNHTGAHNVTHVHPLTDYTCVYYLTDACSCITLENPHPYEQYPTVLATKEQIKKQYNIKPKHRITPSKGDLLIFPSYVPHSVEVNTKKETRISLSWGAVSSDVLATASWYQDLQSAPVSD